MLDRQENNSTRPSDMREDTLKAGDVLLRGQYRIERFLSAGGFGITYLALDSLDRTVVIKECFPNAICCRSNQTVQVRSKSMKEDFAGIVRHFGYEARRLAKLSHPNIVGVHQVFEDKGTAYMALDFIQGRDLMDIIEQDRESLNPDEIKTLMVKLLDAVAYIHENDVLHRDISPDNILIDNSGNPILIDFGAAREVASSKTRALSALHVVKDGYSPQEFYLADGSQAAPSDLYSLAATFYHLITGVPPTNSQVRLAALAAEDPDPYVPIPPHNSGYDKFFLEAFDKALAVFPKHRVQSATEWLELIDTERRQAAMKKRAAHDMQIDLAIQALTEETNLEIAQTTAPVKKKTAPKKKNVAPKAAPAPAPEPAKEPRAQKQPANKGNRKARKPHAEAPAPQPNDRKAKPKANVPSAPPRNRSLIVRVLLTVASLTFARNKKSRKQDRSMRS